MRSRARSASVRCGGRAHQRELLPAAAGRRTSSHRGRLALALAREVRSAPLESAALGVLGAAESALGAHAEALAHLRAAVELRRPSGATPRLGDNLCALALAHLRAGELDAARAAAGELLALYDANPNLAPQPTEWLFTAAQVERAYGARDAADRLLLQAESVMRARAAAIHDAATRTAYLGLPVQRRDRRSARADTRLGTRLEDDVERRLRRAAELREARLGRRSRASAPRRPARQVRVRPLARATPACTASSTRHRTRGRPGSGCPRARRSRTARPS